MVEEGNILGGDAAARQESFEAFLRMCLQKISNLDSNLGEIQASLDSKNAKL